jgi:hypothetical protein
MSEFFDFIGAGAVLEEGHEGAGVEDDVFHGLRVP